jgi:hypothetical protein
MRPNMLLSPLLVALLLVTGCTKKDRDAAARDACTTFQRAKAAVTSGKAPDAGDLATINSKAAQSGRRDLIAAAAKVDKLGATHNVADARDALASMTAACANTSAT